MIDCGICGIPMPEGLDWRPNQSAPSGHPIHTEGEPALIAVRERVDAASRSLYLFAMARLMWEGLR